MTPVPTGGPVICAFEDEAIARHALRGAAWLAHDLDAPLLVAHVFDPLAIPVPSTEEMRRRSITGDDLEREARERTRRRLSASVERICGPDVDLQLLDDQPVAGLLELATDRGARLLVTGTSARIGLDRILAGSVTGDLAARSPCPVIAVPRAAMLEEPGPVLAGYEGSEHGLRAVRHAAALASALDRDLLIVQVTGHEDDEPAADRELAGEILLAATGGRLGDPPREIDLRVNVVHEPGDPADVLVRVARERSAALIFTGTRGRSALASALLGSVSAAVVAVADRPVGLVPATVREPDA